ncbi:uncharacterized protein LOC132255176 [Vitis vinifera]|uniref:uncharacterized protein LOC132255176 n=1 Tax=Vitis vinifera TaxID=29760 RepID=UPI002882F2D6|nr:uncharacterized protein LOC132255176 [Vitis vinifera]
MIATQYQSNIQVIRTDNGGEFVNQDLKQYLNLHGIVHQTICPYTPQQNGVAERKNHHLLKVVRASLFGAHMPTNYWGEAVTTAVYLINRVSSSSLQFQTPFDVLHHTVSAPTIPNLSPKVFGCVAFVHLQKGLRTKLEPRALRCVFVGYALHQKDNLDFISGDNLETSGECPSDGNREEYPGENETGGDGSEGPEFFNDKNQGQMEVQDQIKVLPVPHDGPTNQLSSPANFMPESHSPADSLHESHVNSEFEPRLKVLPNRVTRGKPKVSYEPVLNSKSKYPINNYVSYHRLSKESMAFVNNLDWPLHQFDVKNAFLHENLQEEVYIELPPGCNRQTEGNKQQSNSDHTLFLKYNEDRITTLIVYVDDMIVTGNDSEEMKTLQKHLAREFEMKDLGELKYFLGIEVSRSKKDQVPTNKERYQRLVGRLMYLAHTLPDLAYALSVVSQFMHSPSEEHMNAVIRILCYLKSSPGKGILFTKRDSLDIKGYTDADWARSIQDRRSTSGYFTFVGGNLVTW